MKEFIKEILISLPILLIVVIIASQLVVVPTESMKPVVSAGDVVLVEKTDVLGMFQELNTSTIKVGDIIIYGEANEQASGGHGSEEAIIHRVISVNESEGQKYFIVKGDNNLNPDDVNVTSEQISGRVVTWNGKPITIPKIGYIVLWFKGGNSTGEKNQEQGGGTTSH
jgi:signal peptidase